MESIGWTLPKPIPIYTLVTKRNVSNFWPEVCASKLWIILLNLNCLTCTTLHDKRAWETWSSKPRNFAHFIRKNRCTSTRGKLWWVIYFISKKKKKKWWWNKNNMGHMSMRSVGLKYIQHSFVLFSLYLVACHECGTCMWRNTDKSVLDLICLSTRPTWNTDGRLLTDSPSWWYPPLVNL